MKSNQWLILPVLAVLLAFTGCGKSKTEAPPPATATTLAKLQQALATAPPEVKASLTKVAYGTRYRQYAEAMAELDKIAANPNLTPEQKKAVADFTEAFKQEAARDASAPK